MRDELSFFRGLLYGVPASVLLWGALLWTMGAI